MYNVFISAGAIFRGTGVLFFSLFLIILGNGLQGSLLAIRGSDEGFGMLTLALVSTFYYVGYFTGSFIIPNYIKRVGYIRVFAALVAMASVAAIVYPMFIEKYSWFAMRALTGFCFAGIYIVAESWLNSQTHNANRAKVLGVYIIVIFLGMTLGQGLLTLGDIDGYFLFALASILISIASIPLLINKRPEPIIEETESLGLIKLFKRSPLGAVSAFFANFVNGVIVGMAAVYAKVIGMSTDQIALFIGAAYVAVMVLQFPIGLISDRVDRRKVIISLGGLACILALVAMHETDVTTQTFLLALLSGVSLPLYAVCNAYVNDRLKPNEVLPATTALLKISGLGNMIAPILVGFLMAQFGAQWFFGSIGVAMGVVFVFGIYRMTKRGEVDEEDLSDFAYMGTTATASTIALAYEGTQLEFDFEAYLKENDDSSDGKSDKADKDEETI